jgi:glycosyltransferase involved in cell wall biosynthesis
MNDNLLFIYTHPSSFVKGDISILEKKFEVSEYQFINNPKSKLPISLIRQLLFLIFNIHKFGIVYIWFADYHSLLPILFAKLFRKKSYLVIGGYDICREKKYNYGSLCKPLRAFMSVTSIKQASAVLAVSENVRRILKSIAPAANTLLIYNGITIPATNTPITNNNIITNNNSINSASTQTSSFINTSPQTDTSLNTNPSPEHNTSQNINTSNNTNTSPEHNTSQNINSPNNNTNTSPEHNTSQNISTYNNNTNTSSEHNTSQNISTYNNNTNPSPEHNTSQNISTYNNNTNPSPEHNTSQNISTYNNTNTSSEHNTSQNISTYNNNTNTSSEHNTLSYYTTLERSDNYTSTRSVLCVALVNTLQTFYIKGIDRLNKIAWELPDTPFLLIGCREEIFALAKTAPAPNLKIIPPVPQGQLISYYKQSHVYCQPSRRESFSLSLAEAMFHNMIPVVSTAGGMPEVVQEHGYTIYMNDSLKLQDCSINQMTSAITKALSQHKNPQYREQIIEHFSQHLRKEKIFNAVKTGNSL